MPKPVSDYFERYVPFAKPGTCSAKTGEFSDAEFSFNASEILKEGVAQEQSIDYVTGRLQKLISQNPQLAKQQELPTEFSAIKTQFVEPYYKEANEPQKRFDLSKTADCLMEDYQKTGAAALACAGAFSPIPPTPVPLRIAAGVLGCGAAVTKVAACIQDGTETDK